mgnify:CR=1 FL=1
MCPLSASCSGSAVPVPFVGSAPGVDDCARIKSVFKSSNTARRNYLFTLQSTGRKSRTVAYWMRVRDSEDDDSTPEGRRAAQARAEQKRIADDLRNSRYEGRLNSDYWIAGAQELQPASMFDNGRQTYMTFSAANAMPAAFVIESDGTEAIAHASFDVRPGEFVSVVGPSGCGKSTLLRIASGLLKHTGGTVNVDKESVGYVFQDATLLPWRTVMRNVELLLELHGVPKDERRAIARCSSLFEQWLQVVRGHDCVVGSRRNGEPGRNRHTNGDQFAEIGGLATHCWHVARAEIPEVKERRQRSHYRR